MDTTRHGGSTWIWRLGAGTKKLGGRVLAVDPRDAVSRALTTTMDGGRLVGEAMGIPLTVIDAAPGNQDACFEHVGDGFTMHVQRLTTPEGHPELNSRVRRLKCCCCGEVFEGRQHFNQDTGWGLGDCCIDYVTPHVEDFERTYGVHGVHYGVAR